MKTTFTILLILVVSVLTAQDKYVDTMLKNINSIYQARSAEEYQPIINTFERIGNAEKTKWEPYYYAAFGYIMVANIENDRGKKDSYLDLAVKNVDKAKAIKEDESEIVVLEGFIYMIRVTVDPSTRGQEYSGKSFSSYNKAIALNPDNPRALALLAQMQYGAAQFLGNSVVEACSNVTKALEKFEIYKTENTLAPQWGNGMARSLKTKCQ